MQNVDNLISISEPKQINRYHTFLRILYVHNNNLRKLFNIIFEHLNGAKLMLSS